MSLADFKARNLPEEEKQLCVKQIEKGMKKCGKCEVETVDKIMQACIKHRKMYGRLYP